jgi:transcriptional regulator with XRE-family HTH domain
MRDPVAALLRTAMDRAGMSARQLAAKSGVSEGRVSDYLHARHTPGAAQLLRLLAATGHSLEVVPDLDANGLVLPEVLELGQALGVTRPASRADPARSQLPSFSELVASRV